jgi:hypothetical protein
MKLTKCQWRLVFYILDKELKLNQKMGFYFHRRTIDSCIQQGLLERMDPNQGTRVFVTSGIGKGYGWHGRMTYLRLTEKGRNSLYT